MIVSSVCSAPTSLQGMTMRTANRMSYTPVVWIYV